MFKSRNFCHTFHHSYITYIKRFSALDTGGITKLTSTPSTTIHSQKPRTKSRTKPFVHELKPTPTHTTALSVSNRESTDDNNKQKEREKFRGKFEGTYHFHRRFFCDSICSEHTLNKFEWVRLSRLLKHPYSSTQRQFIEHLFKQHSPNYIRNLFAIWGIAMKDINKYSEKPIKLDHIYLQRMQNDTNNKELHQIMLMIFHKLLYEQQINGRKVVPLDEIVTHITEMYYHNQYQMQLQHQRQLLKSNILKILQSFRQFVVHPYKDMNVDLAQKNPVISIWSQLGNILRIEPDTTQHTDISIQPATHKPYVTQNYKIRKLQEVLIQHEFYLSICVMYHIFGIKNKHFNNISDNFMDKNVSNASVSDEEHSLFVPLKPSKGTPIITDEDIVLRLDANVIDLLHSHGLLPKNLPLIFSRLQHKHKDGYHTSVEMDGVWSVFNNVQNKNDLSLMIIPKAMYVLLASIKRNKSMKHKNKEYRGVLKWFDTHCYALQPSRVTNTKKDTNELDFTVVGIEGDVESKRKLWFMLCYLPCTLGSNYVVNDEVNVLCWLASAIKGWEFEVDYYVTHGEEQRMFEYYCNEYRRIVRDILHSNLREELVSRNGELLISRLAHIYLNDHIPHKWLHEDWLILAKLCPKIVNTNKELSPLVFLMEMLQKLQGKNGDGLNSDILGKLKTLINDEKFVIRLSKSLKGKNESYIDFLETLCAGDDAETDHIVDTNAIHLFMECVLLPSADFLSAFNLLKFMIKNHISMNIKTISLLMRICEYANNSNIMYDVYHKLYHTLGTKICHNQEILKCILRMFLKDNKWLWLNEVFQNVYRNDDEDGTGVKALQKCYVQLIDILVVLTKNTTSSDQEQMTQSDDEMRHDAFDAIKVNKELVSALLIEVFNQSKYEIALTRLLLKTFDEYKQYLYDEKDKHRSGGGDHKYIVYKMNVLQDIIANSSNQQLLDKWDELIIKLRKT